MGSSRIENILEDTIDGRRYTGELLSRVEVLLDILNATLADGGVSPETIEAAVTEWLDNHPEATTTVADNSITEIKLADSYKATTLGYTVIRSVSDF